MSLLLESLNNYYTEEKLDILIRLLNKSSISLRVIDWFITNYSKKYNIEYEHNSKIINIYMSYKSLLKSYSKKFFDPFCRRDRINFKDSISTTIGQLNFFKWAISNGIMDYVSENYQLIDKDMNESMTKKAFKTNHRKKRKELSKSSYKTLTKKHNKIILTFD